MEFSLDNEDIHMNIETILTERIGAAGKRLHTGRSRNDQVAVDFPPFVKQEILKIIDMLLDLEDVLVNKASENLDVVMPGYTHLQRAQPTTFCPLHDGLCQHDPPGYHPLRGLHGAHGRVPAGAGALATSSYPVNRQRTAELLGFKSPPRTAWTPCLTATTPLSF